jgi:hypothetical protein
MHPFFTMHIKRYPVPIGKTLLIGHDHNHHDFIGFEEPANTKYVNLDSSLLREYTNNVCRSCDLYFRIQEHRNKYKETYKNLFLAHPELCVDFLECVGLQTVVYDLYYSWEIQKYTYQVYAKKGLLTTQQLVDGLQKWNEYEAFVLLLHKRSGFFARYAEKASEYVYKSYGKCKDYNFEGKCKKDLEVFKGRKIKCAHNDLYFLKALDAIDFYIYDYYTDNPLSLPNVYSDASVCWGTDNDYPETLSEALVQYFNTPFNGDLLLSTDGFIEDCIEGYGFDSCDFYPYDDDYGQTDYDAEPRSFTVDEIVQIIESGGDNKHKGYMDLTYEMFDIEGVQEILQIVKGRDLPDFAEAIDESFLNYLDASNDVFLFLINDLGGENWEAYLPTDKDEGIYIQVNLNDLRKTQLEDYNNDDD